MSGDQVDASFASTAVLARQVVSGADAHLFLAANASWADHLEERGLVERRVDLLGNTLVIVVPSGSSLVLSDPTALTGADVERVAIADPESVPAGLHAREAFTRLGAWEALGAKLVVAGDVRQALALVERGEVDAGIVFSTDARASDRVQVACRIPESASGPVVYPLLLLTSAAEHPRAVALYDVMTTNESLATFRRHGFRVLLPPPPSELPGGLLTSGMTLHYTANGQPGQVWSIDAIDRELTLAGREGCTTITLTKTPGGPEVRRLHRDADVLHSLTDDGATWKTKRPVGPGMTWDRPNAEGVITSRYETGDSSVVTISGRSIPVVATTITQLDGSGRPKSRLREQYSPGLETATEGVFEAPSESEPSGWATTFRFELVEIREAEPPR